MLIEKHSFEAGCNGDDSVRLIPQNAMLNAMNCRMGVSEFGRNLREENFPGTTAISQSVFPPYGTSQTIMAIPDNSRNRVLFANWNSVGFHGIYCLDYSTPTVPVVYAVLYDSQVLTGLNFSKSFRIDRNASVVGDLLYWTDNNIQPRRINIEAGIKMNHPSYVTTTIPYSYPMNESVIALIRRPFGLSLYAVKQTIGGVTSNFITAFSGRFAARLIYRDAERSVFGSTSVMINLNLASDTYNAVDVTFDINEDFDQDVQIIELAVGYENDPNLFVIKTWNKAVAAEAAQIAAHNAGITPLVYRFFNDKSGIPVGSADSVKPEDAVPTVVKTLTSAVNRLMLANYTKGYDTPTQTSLAVTQTSSSVDVENARIFKSGSPYQVGVRFRDNYGRKSFVVSTPSLISTIPNRDWDGFPYVTNLAWTLSNALATLEIPDWAWYYDIVITKNLRTRYFNEYISIATRYVVGSVGSYSYQNTYSTAVVALSVFPNADYLFSEGDFIRLYINGTATVYDLPIIGVDGTNILFSPVNIGDLTAQPQVIYEIYSPYKSSDEEIFYTTGNSYNVSLAGTSSRFYSTLSGTILGDCYRTRFNTLFGNLVFELMSPNYLVKKDAWFNIYGEPDIQSLLGRVAKPNFVSWSNTIIQGSQTNGLSTFDALDEKALPETMGDINKIQVANKVTEEGNIMLAIGAKETASLYLGEVQLVGASANAFIASSPGVIGTVNILRGSFGTINPESVIEYLGIVFWLDVLNGCFVQYSNAGLEPVSRYKMSRFFKNYCKDYLAASTGNLDNINGFHHIPTGIDPFYKEAFIALPALIYENYATTLPSYSTVPSYATSIINRFDVYDRLGKRMAFCYEENKWGSNFEGLGEMYAYLQNTMFSWKNGLPYTHNTNTAGWNTVYGVQYPVRLCFTGNLNPSALKVLNNIALESNVIPNFTVAYADYPNIQITDLASTDENWVNQEGNMYADFLKDRLSPNSLGTADEKLFTGDDVTDIAIKIMCEWQSYSSLFYCNFGNIGFSLSKGQQQIANPINK